MKRMLAALGLAILTTIAGCADGPHVEKGGGEVAVLEQKDNLPTGRIDFQGHVVNTGESTAVNVVLHFSFFQDGVLYLEQDLLLGAVGAGSAMTYSGSFFGPPVPVASFTWDYQITWD